jgi:two-component system NtrC family response regulator
LYGFIERNPQSGLVLEADVAEALLIYAWPRNVRELEKVAKSVAWELQNQAQVTLDMLPEKIQSDWEAARSGCASLDAEDTEITRDDIEAALKRTNGNVLRAAKILGCAPKTMYRRFKQFDIKPNNFR